MFSSMGRQDLQQYPEARALLDSIWRSIRPEIELVYYLFRTIASSRRCHRIAVEILSGTGTNHAAHKSNS